MRTSAVRKLVADPIAAVAIPLPMPLEAPVTIATLSDSLLMFTILLIETKGVVPYRTASGGQWRSVAVISPADMLDYIQTALRGQAEGTALPFATIKLCSERVVGSTRYMNIDISNRKVEIGSTWIAPPWQRTAVNTEAKHLMLRHAFEEFGCIRVELKTDVLNETSRTAILRIGAKQEGIFRNHVICAGGRIRDSVWFSVIDSEWPQVKKALEEKLSRTRFQAPSD